LVDTNWKEMYDYEYARQLKQFKGKWAMEKGTFDGFSEEPVKLATLIQMRKDGMY
jgi:hypothetical protein